MPTKILQFLLMNEADGGEGAGGGEPAPAPGGEGGEGGAPGSALATGGQAPLSIDQQIPEKYRVFEGEGDDKTFNLEASASKMAEGYGHLAKRMGNTEAPPDSADGYQLDGEAIGVEDVEAFMKDETNQGFLKKCHAKGMNNAQVQMVVEHALKEFAPNLVTGEQVLSTEDCIKELQTNVWGDEQDYATNMASANRAFMSLPKELQGAVDEKLGNDPLFNQVMAMFGKELSEDTPTANLDTPLDPSFDVEAIMSPATRANENHPMHDLALAYSDPNHPKHQQVSKQVSAWFAKKHPSV